MLSLLILITARGSEGYDEAAKWTSRAPFIHLTTDNSSEQNPQLSDATFANCYSHYGDTLWIPALDHSSWNFTSKEPFTCWVYCEHLQERCEAMAFDYITSTCFLFGFNDLNSGKPEGQEAPELDLPHDFIGTLHRSCVKGYRELQSLIVFMEHNKIDLGIERKGLLIKSGFSNDICLSAGEPFFDGRLLGWDHCSKGDEFVFREVIEKNGPLQIQYRQNDSLCVNVTSTSTNTMQAYLAPCHDDTIKRSPQNLKIKWETGSGVVWDLDKPIFDLYSDYFHKDSILFLDEIATDGRQLQTLEFRLPTPNLKPTCPMDNYRIRHSTLVGNTNAPFIFTGDTVTILCDLGYGIPSLDHYPYQVVTCSADQPTPRRCQGKPTEVERGCPRFCDLYLVGLVILAVAMVVVVGGLCMVSACKKHGERREGDKEHGESREGDKEYGESREGGKEHGERREGDKEHGAGESREGDKGPKHAPESGAPNLKSSSN